MTNTLSLDTNFLGTTSIPSELDTSQYAYLQYMYPDNPALSKNSKFNEVKILLVLKWVVCFY